MDYLRNFFYLYKITETPSLIIEDKYLNIEEVIKQLPKYVQSLVSTRGKPVGYYDGVLNEHHTVQFDDSFVLDVIQPPTIHEFKDKYRLQLAVRGIPKMINVNHFIGKEMLSLSTLFNSFSSSIISTLIYSSTKKLTIIDLNITWNDENTVHVIFWLE